MVMEIVVSVALLFVGIAVLVIIHVCIVGRAFGGGSGYINNGGGAVIIAQGSLPRRPSMSVDDIKELPCFEYRAEEGGDGGGGGSGGGDCAVCLESFKTGDKCRLLPKCNHGFHAQCIDSWLLKTGACPICRRGANSPEVGGQSGGSGDVEVELV